MVFSVSFGPRRIASRQKRRRRNGAADSRALQSSTNLTFNQFLTYEPYFQFTTNFSDDSNATVHPHPSAFSLRNRIIRAALSFGFLGCLAANQSIYAQTATSERLVVTGEEVPSAYGATPSFSRSRFSNLVNAYVLPSGAVFAGLIYQGDALRFNRPDHLLTQEVEIGLPYRFGVAFENSIEAFRGHTQERTFSIEGRYALADWNKIPLNPTIFVEYKFGIGDILHDEGPPEPLPKGEAEEFLAEHEPCLMPPKCGSS